MCCNILVIMNKSRVCVYLYLHSSLLCSPVIMQMLRDEWPMCHALLRKMRNSQSDVCCAQRPEANWHLRSGERQRARNGEWKCQTLLPANRGQTSHLRGSTSRRHMRDNKQKQRSARRVLCVSDKWEELSASTKRSVHSHFSQGQAEGQVTLAAALSRANTPWCGLI